jgi:hypothetical protein
MLVIACSDRVASHRNGSSPHAGRFDPGRRRAPVSISAIVLRARPPSRVNGSGIAGSDRVSAFAKLCRYWDSGVGRRGRTGPDCLSDPSRAAMRGHAEGISGEAARWRPHASPYACPRRALGIEGAGGSRLAAGRKAGVKRHAAVDEQRRSHHIVGFVGREPDGRPTDVLRLADPPVGNQPQQVPERLGSIPGGCVDGCANCTGGDGVDTDAVRRDFLRQLSISNLVPPLEAA